ncbi:MAG: RNA 2',3'-cyclic phosphodiesterase [Desulfobacteraceae bacterium]|nr:MAG: RNA 2',3'-cyclic phosphodiesterase [Desulfobacteraceae bacterium]
MKFRSFLAFELSGPLKETMHRVSRELKKTALDAKWVKVDHIHLTLMFLGDIEEQSINQIDTAARAACGLYAPFSVSLKSMGCFPNKKKARVLWLGVGGDLSRMAGFQKILQKDLNPLNVKEEDREFKPHLTLGRFRTPGNQSHLLDSILQQYQNLTSPMISLAELVLFKSDLKPGGAIYTKLKTWPLSGR